MQSSRITAGLGALKNGVAAFENQPIQFEGLPESNKDGEDITRTPRTGPSPTGIVTYAVDGCSVPMELQRTSFPPGLYINKASKNTPVNQHPDAEALYQGCSAVRFSSVVGGQTIELGDIIWGRIDPVPAALGLSSLSKRLTTAQTGQLKVNAIGVDRSSRVMATAAAEGGVTGTYMFILGIGGTGAAT